MSSTVGGLASAMEGESRENHLDNFNVSKGSLYDLVNSPLVNRNSKMLNRYAEHSIALKLLRQSFNSVIHACARAKICKLGVAEHLYRQLRALGQEGMIRDLIQYLHMAEDQIVLTNRFEGTSIYNAALNSLVEANEVRELTSFISEHI